VAAKDPHTKYALGSVLNHVLLHQTVIGLETMEQMALADDEPDVMSVARAEDQTSRAS
jgi:tryptophan synthase beta chain